jgi:hypothetical protein
VDGNEAQRTITQVQKGRAYTIRSHKKSLKKAKQKPKEKTTRNQPKTVRAVIKIRDMKLFCFMSLPFYG